MRRHLAMWLCTNLTPAQKRAWALAMGISMSRLILSLSENFCESHPIRGEDLLFLPAEVRPAVFGLLEEWASAIDRGEL